MKKPKEDNQKSKKSRKKTKKKSGMSWTCTANPCQKNKMLDGPRPKKKVKPPNTSSIKEKNKKKVLQMKNYNKL